MTRLIVIKDSIPLSNTRVRVDGLDSEWETDVDGIVTVEIPTTDAVISVMNGDVWIEKPVRAGENALVVVDITESRSTSDFRSKFPLGERYEIEGVLGRGGMGVVVKAYDHVLGRSVAIKMLSEELSDHKEAQEIFLTEGRSLARLTHPNLVAVYDVTSMNDRALMVLEFVDGRNLEEIIRANGAVDQLEAMQIAIQWARVLQYLHGEGVIHRDLKPANLMVQADGSVKLIDFGLARSLEDVYVRGTRVRGSPAYMAPEQVQGGELTFRSDLYQFGTSLFEILAGELPFTSGDRAFAQVHKPAPRLSTRAESIDTELADLVDQCLLKNSEHRPASATEVLDRLHAIYVRVEDEGPTIGASSLSPTFLSTPPLIDPPLEVPASRRTGLVAVALLLLVSVIGVGVWFAAQTSKPDATPERVVQPEPVAALEVAEPVVVESVTAAPAAVASVRQAFEVAMVGAEAAASMKRTVRPRPKKAARPEAQVKVDEPVIVEPAATPEEAVELEPEPSSAPTKFVPAKPVEKPVVAKKKPKPAPKKVVPKKTPQKVAPKKAEIEPEVAPPVSF